MTDLENTLLHLSEECLEVAQRVSKAMKFGLSEVQPGQALTNAERIEAEFADILGVYGALMDRGALKWPTESAIVAKKAKMARYSEYQKELGTVTP